MRDEDCIYWPDKPWRRCYGCIKKWDPECPAYEVGDVEPVEPKGLIKKIEPGDNHDGKE